MATPVIRAAAFVWAALLVLSACGGGGAAPAPDGRTPDRVRVPSSSQSPTSSTSTPVSTQPPAASSPVQQAPASTAAAGPTFVECVYGGGAWTESALMSDGSFRIHPTCAALRAEQLAKYPYVCPRTDHQVADLSECGPPVRVPEERPVQTTEARVDETPAGGAEPADDAATTGVVESPTESPSGL